MSSIIDHCAEIKAEAEARKRVTTFQSKYRLLQRVRIDGDIRAIVTPIQFQTNSEPLIKVEWFAQGMLQAAWLNESELEIFMEEKR